MTVNDCIKRALRLLGVIDPQVNPEAGMVAEGLVALNQMLASWGAQKNAIYAPVSTTFSTVSGTATYTIGSGGDINVTRPKNIMRAWIRESDNSDYHLNILAMDNYIDIVDKTVESRPISLYHERKYPLGDVTLYYTPDAVYTVHLKLWASFTVYTTTTESLALPLEYEKAVCSNLAIDLASEYQTPISRELALMATDSLGTVKELNSLPIARVQTDPFKMRTPTSILEG